MGTTLPSVARKNGKTKSQAHVFSMIFSRTNLRTSQSRAKKCEESAGNVRFDVAPQKPSKNMVKRAFETKHFRKKISTSKNEMLGIV